MVIIKQNGKNVAQDEDLMVEEAGSEGKEEAEEEKEGEEGDEGGEEEEEEEEDEGEGEQVVEKEYSSSEKGEEDSDID